MEYTRFVFGAAPMAPRLVGSMNDLVGVEAESRLRERFSADLTVGRGFSPGHMARALAKGGPA